MRGRLATVAASVAAGALCGVVLAMGTEAATLRVVDDATGDPLEGAVVVVIWYRATFHGGSTPYHVVERVAAPSGQVSLSVAPGVTALMERREVMVYKTGYRPVLQHTKDRSRPLFDRSVIGLAKIRTPQEAQRYRASSLMVAICSRPDEPYCVRREQAPHLVRLLEVEQKLLGEPGPVGPLQGLR